MAVESASALIMTGRGNRAVHDAGWPEGALAMANFESRIGWWEGPPFGGGEWHFLYQGNTAGMQDALQVFAAIRAPKLELVLHDGPHEDSLLKEHADWEFTVWVPANWHRLFNNPKSVFEADQRQFRQPVDPPRLDVYVGGGGVEWEKVKVPAHVTVRDERTAGASGKADHHPAFRVDIYDMATGKPVTGARVMLERSGGAGAKTAEEKLLEAASDATGRAQIATVPAGTYRAVATAEGYAGRVGAYERYSAGASKSLTLQLAKSSSVQGRVLDDGDKPVKGVKVRASNTLAIDGRGYTAAQPPEAVSNDDGAFTLAGLPIGFAQFRIYEAGYYFGGLFTIYDVPDTNIVLRLTRAGGLRVAVTDKEGKALSRYEGRPLYVNVEPEGGSKPGAWGGGATVKEDGMVEFKNMPPGRYRLSSRPNPANSNQQYTPEQVVNVTPGEPTLVKMIYE